MRLLLPFIKAVLLLLLAHGAYARNGAVLAGHIAHRAGDSIMVTYNDNNLAYYPQELYATVDKAGNFTLRFPLPAQVYQPAELHYRNHIAEVILQSGDSLYVDVDSDHFDSTIHYSGNGSAIQNFVARHTIEKGRMNQYAARVKAATEKEPAAFMSALAAEQDAELAFLDKHSKGLPAPFAGYWKAYYRYYNYYFMEQYPQMHEIVRLKRYTDTIPNTNYAVIRVLPYAFNDSMMQLPPYLLYLSGIFEIKMKAAGYNLATGDTAKRRVFADSLTALAYKAMPPQSAAFFIAQGLYATARYQPLARTRAQYSAFKKRWPASEYLALLDMQVAIAERLAPGQPAPDLDLLTPEGTRMKLSDLRGKVVYLGFWATWCRQCVGEMMGEAKTKSVLKDKPVAFVYISLDNDTASAMRVAHKYKIDGIYHFAKGGWKSGEVQAYGVQGMPAYFLIDKEGNIAVQSPPSPMQSTELIVAISRLL